MYSPGVGSGLSPVRVPSSSSFRVVVIVVVSASLRRPYHHAVPGGGGDETLHSVDFGRLQSKDRPSPTSLTLPLSTLSTPPPYALSPSSLPSQYQQIILDFDKAASDQMRLALRACPGACPARSPTEPFHTGPLHHQCLFRDAGFPLRPAPHPLPRAPTLGPLLINPPPPAPPSCPTPHHTTPVVHMQCLRTGARR